MIADVAHNPDGMRTLMSSVEKLLVGSCIVVFGVLRDKDYHAMIDSLAPRARMLIGVKPQTERALETAKIVEYGQKRGLKSIEGGTVAAGIQMASGEAREGETVLVAGSHYVVGEALDLLQFDV